MHYLIEILYLPLQLLKSTVNFVLTSLKTPTTTSQWKSILAAPLPHHRQFDGWSCGLFTMMAMQNLVKFCDLELVRGDEKDSFRSKVLKRILEIP